jgi:mono/diheme cytochrome c family protein
MHREANTSRWMTIIAFLAIVMVIVAANAASRAAQAPAGLSPSAPDGASLYRTYCASCHGGTGHGDGPVAAFLSVPPTDLTQIAKRANGIFPAGEVARVIDGRQRVRAHGGSDMPVWGDGFSRSISAPDEATIRARIEAVVKYLASIQERRARIEPRRSHSAVGPLG